MDSASIRVPYKNLKQAEVELMRLEESHCRSSEVDHSPNGISPSASSSVHPAQHNMSMATLILSCTVAAGVQFGWALQLSLLTPYIQTMQVEDMQQFIASLVQPDFNIDDSTSENLKNSQSLLGTIAVFCVASQVLISSYTISSSDIFAHA